MDNITHSLTGAVAAKVLTSSSGIVPGQHHRTLFWLTVVCANLPDIDAALRLFTDYFSYVMHHRGLTHSLVFAPVFALLPAAITYKLGSVKNFRLLWSFALIGICVHIFFDLITTFGTRILYPLSDKRFALDWMFIIDPVFTGSMALLLLSAKILKRRARILVRITLVFVIAYLSLEAFLQTIALKRVHEAAAQRAVVPVYSSALPQPFSIFRWNGLVQTERGVHQAFFSVFDDSLSFSIHINASGPLVDTTMSHELVRRYLTFARHPYVTMRNEANYTVVTLRDLQFSTRPELLERFGMTDTPQPFIMEFYYDEQRRLNRIMFDRKPYN